MKQYDAYLFDWDGTLGRTLETWLEVMHTQFKRYGIHGLSDTDVVKSFGRLKYADKDFGIPSAQLEKFKTDVQNDARKHAATTPLYQGVLPMLERLQNNGRKLALITTNWREAVDIMLKNSELEKFFSVVISGDEVKTPKPDPEGVLSAISTLGVSKERTVMLGDSPHDLEAASNAGIDSILYYPLSHQLFYELTALQKFNPTYVIDGWDKL
jgi:HAD superfamily hydrolase (TIGR01509 family)